MSGFPARNPLEIDGLRREDRLLFSVGPETWTLGEIVQIPETEPLFSPRLSSWKIVRAACALLWFVAWR